MKGYTSIPSVGRAFAAAWLIVIGLATVSPSGEQRISGSLCLICGEVGGTDAVLNVLLYLPLGLGLALAGVRAARALPLMVVITASIEFLQWIAIPGRDGTLGDVLTNSVGGAIGFLVGSHAGTLLFPEAATGAWLTALWMCVWIAVQAASSYALQPRPTDTKYYGQLTRPLGSELAYPGRVLQATVAGSSLPDWDLPDSHRAYLAFADTAGASIELLVESRGLSPGFAPIARVLDDSQREEFMVGAERTGLVFGVRTGAAVLRLRPPEFTLPAALAEPFAPRKRSVDTLRLRARYAPPVVELSATGAGGAHHQTLRLTSASGWRLITPIYTSEDGSALSHFLDATWLFALTFPTGWWVVAVVSRRKAPSLFRTFTAFGLVAIALFAGLCVGPMAYGTAWPSWWELAGIGGGACIGSLAARACERRWTPQGGA